MHWHWITPMMVPVVMLPLFGVLVGSRRWRALASRKRVALFASWATAMTVLFLLAVEFKR